MAACSADGHQAILRCTALVERPVVLAFEQWLMAQCGLAAAVASAPDDRKGKTPLESGVE